MRKQPSQSRSAAIVDAILGATTRLLPLLGAEKVSTNRIAEVAGISVGSLYQYFQNRESILIRLIEKDLEANEKKFLHCLDSLKGAPLDKKIERVVEVGFEIFMDRRTLKRVLFPHAYRLKRVREVFEARNVLALALAELFNEHASDLKMDNPKRSAYVLSHSVQGLLQMVIVLPEAQYSDDELKAEIIRMIRGYLGLSLAN
jgi:AcrR family transcriptional regulator